ncbi:MAG: DUF2012 domain-containing protein [Candidatus Lambdaproteobacteria bacterium]|nr:DUF2012 domain-containing protein [Candidatus Lambdaproteobacteria bacterium]
MSPNALKLAAAIACLALGQAPFTAVAAKYIVRPVSNGGAIGGTVKLIGMPPGPEKILVTKNEDVCGKGYREVQWVPVGPGKGLQETVVFLEQIGSGKPWEGALDSGRNHLNQKNCLFVPWLQIVRHGSELTIQNSDPVLHNVHIRELVGVKVGKPRGVKRTMLNEAQPGERGAPAADLMARIEPRRGNLIAVNCEAHNFMFAWMFAAAHPYTVKTGDDGSYRLENVPPGEYVLQVWHPTLGLQEARINVEADKLARQDFTYSAGG